MTEKASVVGATKNGLIFSDPNASEGPNQVLAILPVETYLVQYTDKTGKKMVRLVFRAQGAEETIILQDRIQGSMVSASGAAWFNKAFSEKLKKDKVESV
jgi:hypothetical protein